MSVTVGVIGLGPMGGNIAGNLLKNGFTVIGYDLVPDRMSALDDLGLQHGESATDVAQRADLLCSSLPNVGALHEVIEAVLQHPQPGQILVECSTLTVAQKLAAHEQLAAGDKIFLDAPISGTPPMLAKMMASIYVSGDEGAYQSSIPVLEGFTATNFYVGEVGKGYKIAIESLNEGLKK